LSTGLWWSTLQKNAKEFCKTCEIYQIIGKPSRRDDMPSVPQVTLQYFDKWGLDCFLPINPSTKISGVAYIITAKSYLTIWTEEEPFRDCSVKSPTLFLFENVATRFGFPIILMSDQGTHFMNRKIASLKEEF
jgi:hypothetical protein